MRKISITPERKKILFTENASRRSDLLFFCGPNFDFKSLYPAARVLIFVCFKQCLYLLSLAGQQNINDPLLTPVEVKAEMRQLVEEFHIRMQRTYCALKIKHRRELLKIREKRTLAAFVAQIHSRKYSLEQQV